MVKFLHHPHAAFDDRIDVMNDRAELLRATSEPSAAHAIGEHFSDNLQPGGAAGLQQLWNLAVPQTSVWLDQRRRRGQLPPPARRHAPPCCRALRAA